MTLIKSRCRVVFKVVTVLIVSVFFINGQVIAQVTDLPKLSTPKKEMPAEAKSQKGTVSRPPAAENNKTSTVPKSLSESAEEPANISAADRAMISKACRSSQ